MKIKAIHITVAAAVLVAGWIYRFHSGRWPAKETCSSLLVQADAPEKEPQAPRLDAFATISPPPKSLAKEPKVPAKVALPRAHEQPKGVTEKQRRATQYWQRVARRFEHQRSLLGQEDDQAKRKNLIRAMAMNIRIDTLSTLDWAMSMEDTAEKRAAMESINRYALIGIGAWLDVDGTGLPKIKEATILGGLASTGMAESGDYISGVKKEDGSIVYFKDRPLHQVVRLLRGKPGTEVHLLMERVPADGTAPYSFDVPVLRSMIIVQPPD